MPDDAGVLSVDLTQIDAELAARVGALLARVWPKPEKDAAYRAAQLIKLGTNYEGPAEQAPRLFYVADGDQVIGVATMRPRAIRFGQIADNLGMTIMGLGLVGSDPERRGEGLGGQVVRASFRMIDQGAAAFSLFQTTHQVRPFYEKLGACLVKNRVVNSLGPTPSANPFWDEVVMRYPNQGDWPAGVIDLLGPGY